MIAITTGVKIVNYEIDYCLIIIIQQDKNGNVISIDHKEVNLNDYE